MISLGEGAGMGDTFGGARMSRFSAVLVTATVVAGFAVAADATAVRQLAVSASTGQDTNDCSSAAPCATIQHAVQVAGDDPTAIVVSDGSYAGPVTVAAGQQIVLRSTGYANGVTISAPDGEAALTNNGTLALSAVTLKSSTTALEQQSGAVSLSDVVGDGSGLVVDGGRATVSSQFGDNEAEGLPMTVHGGSLRVNYARIFSPVVQTGGDLVVDHFLSYGVRAPFTISGGTTLIANSVISGGSQDSSALQVSGAADVTVDRSSFTDNDQGLAVDGSGAVLTVLSSSVFGDTLKVTGGGTLRLAGSVIDDIGSLAACNGPIVDGGYNSAPGNSCGFTDPTSRVTVASQELQQVSDPRIIEFGYRGPSSIVIPLNVLVGADGEDLPNPLVDAIPAAATPSFDPTVQLCEPADGVDQIGQPVAVGGRCDIGAIELAGSTVALSATPAKAVAGQRVTLIAHVDVAVGSPNFSGGTVTITDGGRALADCSDLNASAEDPASCVLMPTPGIHHYAATFVPGYDAHPSATAPLTVNVGKAAVAITLHVPSVTYGSRSAVTADVMNATTHTPAVVNGQLWVRTPTAPWHPLGRVLTSNTAGHMSESIKPLVTADYQLRTFTSSQYLPSTSPVVHSTVRRTH